MGELQGVYLPLVPEQELRGTGEADGWIDNPAETGGDGWLKLLEVGKKTGRMLARMRIQHRPDCSRYCG